MVDGHWTASKGELLKPNLGPGAFDEITIRRITMFSQHKISLSSCLFVTIMTFDGLNITHWWFGTCFFPYTGNNHPNWLLYFSEGLKPPTRHYGHLGHPGKERLKEIIMTVVDPSGEEPEAALDTNLLWKVLPIECIYIYFFFYNNVYNWLIAI